MSTAQQPLDTLRRAYQIEMDGYTFYSMAAEKARSAAVGELFVKLAGDEKMHQAYLKDVIRYYDVKGTAAFSVPLRSEEMRELTGLILPDRLGVEAAAAEAETAVLSIGIQLETNAVACYSEAASQAGDSGVQGFYTFLADWEKQHLNALTRLHAALRSGSSSSA